MKTYKYKTLEGFLNNCSGHISIYKLLDGVVYHERSKQVVKVVLSDSAKMELAQGFADYAFSSKPAKDKLINRLMYEFTDITYLQGFYLSKRKKGFGFSNSLSGESFRYCLRMFCK